MRADYHMHTWFSKDSDASPESMVEGAIAKGLESICFTDHEDKDYEMNGEESVVDTDKYFAVMSKVQEKYADRLHVRIGIELGLQPHLGEFFRRYTEEYPFDFVIGSVHVVNAKDPYYQSFFEGISDEEGYRMTLEETLKDIKAFDGFDVLGHLDYVVRYGRNKEKEYSYQRFAPLIDEILRLLIERGKGIELNMAGFKYGLPFAHPHTDVLKRYRELGGEIVTVGADAHRPEHIAYDFDRVPAILESCGFKYYTEFVDRKPVFKKVV